MGKSKRIVLALVLFCGVAQAADRSLSPADYMAKGMPAVDRPWTGNDYDAAVKVLQGLDSDQLPRSASPLSAPVMARLIDPHNLDYCRDRATPLGARMTPCLTMLKATSQALQLYANSLVKNPGNADDMVAVSGYVIQTSAVAAGQITELLPTLDSKDPNYATRMGGLTQAGQGLAQVVNGALLILSDRTMVSDPARIRFATIIADNFAEIAERLPPLSVTEFQRRLRTMAQTDPSPGVRLALAGFASEAPAK